MISLFLLGCVISAGAFIIMDQSVTIKKLQETNEEFLQQINKLESNGENHE